MQIIRYFLHNTAFDFVIQEDYFFCFFFDCNRVAFLVSNFDKASGDWKTIFSSSEVYTSDFQISFSNALK